MFRYPVLNPAQTIWMMIVLIFNFEYLLWISCSGEKATAECVADAIADNRAELVHLPSTIDLNTPLPSKECPTCDGTVSLTFLGILHLVPKVFHVQFYYHPLLENFLNWTIFGFDPWLTHVLFAGSNALPWMQAQITSQDLCGWCELLCHSLVYETFGVLHYAVLSWTKKAL